MNRRLIWAAGSVWSSLVYTATVWAAWPSEPVARFVEQAVAARGTGWEVALEGTSLWWMGVAADGVILKSASGGVAKDVAFFDELRARVSPWGFFRGTTQLTVEADVEGATVSTTIHAVPDEGELRLRRVVGETSDFPLETLAGLFAKEGQGPLFEGAGGFDGSWELKVHDGMKNASGELSLVGEALRVSRLTAPDLGFPDLELDLQVSEFDLQLKGENGIFSFERGAIRTSLAQIDITGDVTLDERLERSRVKLGVELELGDLDGSPFAPFKAMLEARLGTRCDDGRYHYTVNTSLNRLGLSDLRPEPCRGSGSSSRTSSRVTPPAGATPGVTPPAPLPTEAPPPERPARDPDRADRGVEEPKAIGYVEPDEAPPPEEGAEDPPPEEGAE
jgi:type II secretion system protein N